MLNRNAVGFLIFILLPYFAFGASVAESTPASTNPETQSATNPNYFSVVNTYYDRFLHQGTTLSLLHTTKNRLWVSNYDGVFLAKGKHIKYHNDLFSTTAEFSPIRIRALVEVWEGKVIAITDSNKLLLYDEAIGVFKAPGWLNRLGGNNADIADAYFSRRLGLLIGLTNGRILNVLDDGEVKFNSELGFNQSVTDFFEDDVNGYILASSTSKVARYSYHNNSVDIYDISATCGKDVTVREVSQTPSGDIWVGTSGAGLLTIDTKSHECMQSGSTVDTQKDFAKSTIHELTVDKPTGLSIVSTDQGIFVFRADLVIQNFTTSNSKLSNNEVISLASDHSGGYWVGTYNGINRLILSPFELFDQNTHEGLHSVVGFESLRSDQILVASYSGLFLTDIDSRTFSRLEDHSPEISVYGERIMAIFADREDIYLGYRNSGFEVINLVDSKFSRWNARILKGLASNSVSAFLKLSSGRILVGTYGGGLTIFEEQGSSRNITSATSGGALKDDRIVMLFKSSDGIVWVGTESGLHLYDPIQDSFQIVSYTSHDSHRQRHPLIWSMAESSDYLWYGSLHRGIFRLPKSEMGGDYSEIELQRVALDAPISDITVYAIEIGVNNEIWFSTNQGISRLADDGRLVNFGYAHGLQETEFELGSSHKDEKGNIYFGGNHGYNRFDPKKVAVTNEASDVVLNEVILDYGGIYPRPLTSTIDSITLSHKDRFITFEFSALDYTDPESTLYRHKLVGFDTDWVDIGNRGSATYTNLPAGDYVFRVQAVNSAGIWNYDGLAIDLRVNPAPWLTWWAFMAYILAAIGAAAWFLRFYRRNMLRDQQLKQATEMQRIADRIADELQDQIDFQSKFTDSVHSYNKALLYWARFCTDSTIEYERSVKQRVHDRILFRLGVLEIIQDSLYHQGERLYVQLHDCATKLSNTGCESHPQVRDCLTVVNDIQKELIPAAQAIPLAIMLAELIDNSMTHAFDGKAATCFVRFSVTLAANPDSSSDTVSLIYQDDGVGVPSGLTFESPESAGFAIIGHAAESLQCELAIGETDRTTITGRFNLPWGYLRLR